MRCEPLTLRLLITLSVATSIDALAVGFSTPFMELEVVSMSLAAGLASLTLAILGYFMGLRVRGLAGEKASIIGGAILVLLGLKILLEHLAGAA